MLFEINDFVFLIDKIGCLVGVVQNRVQNLGHFIDLGGLSQMAQFAAEEVVPGFAILF